VAYRLPTFNLQGRLRRWSPGPYPGPGLGTLVSCGLRLYKTSFIVNAGFNALTMVALVLPKGTDIRGNSPKSNGDIVEVPNGSGRFYIVNSVDDVAKGFANEYRFAAMTQVQIPFPIP